MQETELIRQADQPGLFRRRQERLEAEDPSFARERRIAIQESELMFQRMFDEFALERRERRGESVLRRAREGRDQELIFDIADERGDTTPFIDFLIRLRDATVSSRLGPADLGGEDTQPSRQTRALEEARDLLREQNTRALPSQPEN